MHVILLFVFLFTNFDLNVASPDIGSLLLVEIIEVDSVGYIRELKCITKSSRFEWLFNDQPVANFPFLKKSNNNLIINITSLETSFGVYKCRAYNSAGESTEAIFIYQAHGPLIVEVIPNSANLSIGDDASFNCSFDNKENLEVIWSKDGNVLPANAITNENGLLKIKNLQEYNKGHYLCSVLHRDSGVIKSASARLDVSQFNPLKVSIKIVEGALFVGQSVKLNCFVNGGNNPKVTWSKINDEFDERFIVNGTFLSITRLSNDDIGNLQCKVDTESESSVVYLPIFKEAFEVGNENKECEANEIKCLNGDKKCVSKSWICDGEADCNDGSDEIDALCTSLIAVDRCKKKEFLCRKSGQCIHRAFLCDGENDCFDQTDEIGCVTPTITNQTVVNVSVNFDEKLVLTCTANGFPAPFINWRHNWNHVCSEPRCKIENFGNGTGVFTIYNVQAIDAGAYTCEAVNSKGRSFSNDIHVEIVGVFNAPFITYPQVTEVYGRENKSFIIDCKASGYPMPDIFFETPKTEKNNHVIKKRETFSSYFISKLSTSDLGVYKCIVENKFGKVSKDIYVNIISEKIVSTKVKDEPLPPEVSFQSPTLYLSIGSTLDLKAIVKNIENSTFSWTKNNLGLGSNAIVNENSLFIKRLSKDDEGLYELTVSDSNGSKTASVFVYVEESISTVGIIKKIIINTNSTVVLNVGDYIKLICDPKRKQLNNKYQSAIWNKNIKNKKLRKDVLTFKNLTYTDAINYTCTIKRDDGKNEILTTHLQFNERGSKSSVTNSFDVYRELPTAKVLNEYREIKVNDRIELNCITSGASKIIWLFNNTEIIVNENYDIQNDILIIKRLTNELMGQYTCSALNTFGDSTESTIRIQHMSAYIDIDRK